MDTTRKTETTQNGDKRRNEHTTQSWTEQTNHEMANTEECHEGIKLRRRQIPISGRLLMTSVFRL